jgi:hypothetical protein
MAMTICRKSPIGPQWLAVDDNEIRDPAREAGTGAESYSGTATSASTRQ